MHVNALLARGACFNKIGQSKEALDDYDNALTLDSEKSKSRGRNESRRKLRYQSSSEEDILKPNENKLKLLEIDTSTLIPGQTEMKN